MIKRLYEAITGTPWTTGRCASVDFGPTIAARYPELAALSDVQLMCMSPLQAIAYAEAARANTRDAWLDFIDTHLSPRPIGHAVPERHPVAAGRRATHRVS